MPGRGAGRPRRERTSHAMRVLHLRASTGFAGPEQGLLRLGVALRDLGVTVKIIAYCRYRRARGDIGWLMEEAHRRQLAIEYWEDRGKLPLADIGRLADTIREGRYDVLVTHDHKSDLMGYLATRRGGFPWIAAPHGYDFSLKRMHLYRRLDVWLLRRADRVLPVSRWLQDELVGAGVPRVRTLVVRNGIDVAAFTAAATERSVEWRRRLGHEAGPVV